MSDPGGNGTSNQRPLDAVATKTPQLTTAAVTHGGAYPAGGGVSHGDGLDGAAAHAANNAPEDQDFFAGVLGQMLQGKQPAQLAEEDIDEEGVFPSPLPPATPPPLTTPQTQSNPTSNSSPPPRRPPQPPTQTQPPPPP